jgi:hypothetical protein
MYGYMFPLQIAGMKHQELLVLSEGGCMVADAVAALLHRGEGNMGLRVVPATKMAAS